MYQYMSVLYMFNNTVMPCSFMYTILIKTIGTMIAVLIARATEIPSNVTEYATSIPKYPSYFKNY